MKKETAAMLVLVLFIISCVPKPEPYVLPERGENRTDIAQEIAQLEEQAREQAREKIAAEQAAQEQQQKATEAQQAKADEKKEPAKLEIQNEALKDGTALGLYPGYFMDGEAFKSNFVTIVGEEAPSSYVVALGNLVARTPGVKPTGFSMLDSDISDITKYNAIIVGNACNNAAIARMFSNPSPCESTPLPTGKGFVKIYQAANGNVALLAAGKTDAQVVAAINAIGTDQFISVNGNEICVQGASLVQC